MPGLVCAVHQPNFFPRLPTLAKLCAADVWVILDDVQFSRRDYQHRCYLPGGAALPARWLTVPVHLPAGRATIIRDARIADPVLTAPSARAAPSALLQEPAPGGDLGPADRGGGRRRVLRKGGRVSERTTIALLNAIGWRGRIFRSSDIAARTGRSERLADLTMSVGATAYLCGTGGSSYLDPAPFTAQGLEVLFFSPQPRLASLPLDACRRATALADLAEAGPRALARHLDSHAAAWRNSLPVMPRPGPQAPAIAERAGTAPGGTLALTARA
jgi:hypothetical protein